MIKFYKCKIQFSHFNKDYNIIKKLEVKDIQNVNKLPMIINKLEVQEIIIDNWFLT